MGMGRSQWLPVQLVFVYYVSYMEIIWTRNVYVHKQYEFSTEISNGIGSTFSVLPLSFRFSLALLTANLYLLLVLSTD